MTTATAAESGALVPPPYREDEPLYEIIDGRRVEMPPDRHRSPLHAGRGRVP